MNNTINSKIKNYRLIAELSPAVIRTIKKWDGKCYNKRFIDDLKAETECLAYADTSTNGRFIYIHLCPDTKCYSNWQIALALDRQTMQDEKRISATAAMKDLDERRNDFLNRAAELEKYNDDRIIATIKEQIEIIRKMANHALDGVPSEIKDLYKLSTTIHVY